MRQHDACKGALADVLCIEDQEASLLAGSIIEGGQQPAIILGTWREGREGCMQVRSSSDVLGMG